VHKCVQIGATCADAYDVRAPSGEVTPCPGGTLCVAGSCTTHCDTAKDCAPGYDCVGQRCAPAVDGGSTRPSSAAAPGSSGGCGCVVGAPGAGTDTIRFGCLLATGLALRARRRRKEVA
jgi:hypothetical protein